MKSPRVTTRRLMVAVACVGVLLAYGERRRRYRRLAAHHAKLSEAIEAEAWKRHPLSLTWVPRHPMPDEISRFHFRKSVEYERAAPWPWIVVVVEAPPRKEDFPPSFGLDWWPLSSEADRLKPTLHSP